MRKYLLILIFLPALIFSSSVSLDAEGWIIKASDIKDSRESNCIANSKNYPNRVSNPQTSIFISEAEDWERPLIIIEISNDKILEAPNISSKVIASLFRVNYEENQKLFGNREGTALFQRNSDYGTFIGNRGGKKVIRIGFNEDVFKDYEFRSKNSGQSDNWEQMKVTVDTSKYFIDRKSIFDMTDFSNIVTILLLCHQNLDNFKKQVNAMNYKAEIQKKKELAELQAKRKRIEREAKLQDDLRKARRLSEKQERKNQCLSMGIYWRWIDMEPYSGYCVNIFASRSSSSSGDNEDDTEDEDELMDDSWFDEGTPQCDEGTWYEENGYC